jgi:hypothetical protein
MKRLALALLCLGSLAYAAPRDKPGVTRIARNDGNTRLPFTVLCLDSAWTVVGSTKTVASQVNATGEYAAIRRRSITIQTLSTVNYAVCLSTISASADTCQDATTGYELGSSWASVSAYDEGLWYCRTRSGGSTRIKGVEFYDNRDEVK